MSKNPTSITFDELKKEFTKANGKIIIYKTDKQRTLPTDVNILKNYLDDLFNTYNNFAAFAKENVHQQDELKQKAISKNFETKYKPRLFEALEVLQLTAQVPEKFEPIDSSTLAAIKSKTTTAQIHTTPPQDSDTGGASGSADKSQKEPSTNVIEKETVDLVHTNSQNSIPEIVDIESHNSESDNSESVNFESDSSESVPNEFEMADQTIEQFLRSAAPLLNYKYDGDPLKLNGFMRDVKLIAKLAKNDTTKEFCLSYVLARLEGRAEELVPDDTESIDDILAILDENIKPDSTKIIEGRMMALRLNQNDYTKFAKSAEELSESFRRGLINDGVPRKLAEEMTIKKCIELCRKTSRSDVAKSVITSTQYDTAKDVIATFIVENDVAKQEYKEKQMLKQKFNKNDQKRGGNRGNFRGNQNRSNDNRSQNYNNGQRNDQNQNQNQSRGYNNQNRGNGNSNRGGYRGGYRGGNSNQPEHTIRIVSGQPPAAQAEQITQPEQFFRIGN